MHTTKVEFIKLEEPVLAPWLCRLAQEFFLNNAVFWSW